MERHMQPFDQISWEILNATADDWENLEQIYRLLPRDVASLEEIADRLPRLVATGLLNARVGENGTPPSLADFRYVWHAWFAMSAQGRAVWTASIPADLAG